MSEETKWMWEWASEYRWLPSGEARPGQRSVWIQCFLMNWEQRRSGRWDQGSVMAQL